MLRNFYMRFSFITFSKLIRCYLVVFRAIKKHNQICILLNGT